MKVAIVASLAHAHELKGYDVYIGCDLGAFVCAQAHVQMMAAVGDFDSVTEDQLEAIHAFSKHVHTLSKNKDVSDTEYALSLTNPQDEVVILGGLGGRKDHEWANVLCLLRYPYARLENDTNKIQVIHHKNTIKKEKQYMSIFPFYDCVISIQGVQYPLLNHRLEAFSTLGLSNEIILDEATIDVSHPCLLIQSE